MQGKSGRAGWAGRAGRHQVLPGACCKLASTLLWAGCAMPRYVRPKVTGATVFFTVALAQRGADTLVRESAALREAVRITKGERPFAIDAWVVLPDHLHAVWTLPAGDADFSGRWKDIKTRFTKATGVVGRRSASKVAKGEMGLWQRRFRDHHVCDEADLAAHLRYCWGNPVKHGLVARPTDWPWSSLHRDIREGRVEADWAEQAPDGDYGE